MSSPVQESEDNTLPAAPDSGTAHNNEPSGTTVTDTDSDEENSASENPPTFTIKMLNLCKEITIMIFIVVAYAAITNEPPKVSKSPAAYPFFPKDSLVSDWYKGQVTEAIEEARASDIAFVMFYAPWDAESQHARAEFEYTARFMHEEVAFAAVNCWQPGSECKRQYSKVYKWPVLIAYPTHGRGIQYNGPLEAFHMIKFLQNMCKPVSRPSELEELMGKYDTIVSAKINVLPGSYEYAVFYSAALRFLERDPFRDIAFAVLPQKKDKRPTIKLHNWNETLLFGDEWNVDNLLSWIGKNSHPIVNWASPSGLKSLTLSGFLQPGPTLVLFTPRNHLIEQNDYCDMLREVAYEYFNCANDTYVTSRKQLVNHQRIKNQQNFKTLKQYCHKSPRSSTVWTNSTVTDICNCKDVDKQCRMFLLAERYAPPRFSDTMGVVNVSGLACATNQTLTFVVMDSLRLYYFAETLGVDLAKAKQRSQAVIINEKMETHSVLNADVTMESLRSFVYNFTLASVTRSVQSKIRTMTHVYPTVNCSSDEFCIQELTSDSFLPTVLTDKVVVVYYYSKQCSFCNGIAYTFLTLARMLATLTDDIFFARIDGDLHLLPWEYTMESFPTVLFFPAKGKSESRAFPKNIPITVPNLLSFILTNVEPVLKLKTIWSLCLLTKFADDKSKCLTSLRMEVLTIIDKTLKEWRVSKSRQKVLYKLQLLRQLHLFFAHSPKDHVKITSFLKRLGS